MTAERLVRSCVRVGYPVPAVRLGTLAVATPTQGMGISGELLRDALLRTVSLLREAGTRVVLVDAIDEKAKAFHERYGFIPLLGRRVEARGSGALECYWPGCQWLSGVSRICFSRP